MPAKDLGLKHTCFKCGTKFYDMKKPEPVCPKCGADQREAAALKASEKSERKRAHRARVEEEPEIQTEEAAEEEEGLLAEADEEDAEEPGIDEVADDEG